MPPEEEKIIDLALQGEEPAITPKETPTKIPAPADVVSAPAKLAPAEITPENKTLESPVLTEPAPPKSTSPVPAEPAPAEPPTSEEKGGRGEKTKSIWRTTVVRPLRTYRDDVSRLVQKKGTSYLSMATAEYERRGGTAPKRTGKPRVFAFLSVILIIMGVGAISYISFKPKIPASGVTVGQAPKALVFVEAASEADVTGQNSVQLIAALKAKQNAITEPPGIVTHVYLTKETDGGKKALTTNEFLRTVSTNLPAALLRTFSDNFMFGFYGTNIGNHPFLILKTNSYEQTYAGMLAWEPFMREDISFLVAIAAIDAPSEASGTTTTAVITSENTFVDRVVKNKDTRVLFNRDGSVALIYALPDTATVVITNNETTLNTIVSRLTRTVK